MLVGIELTNHALLFIDVSTQKEIQNGEEREASQRDYRTIWRR
jgi:hypothetical protein